MSEELNPPNLPEKIKPYSFEKELIEKQNRKAKLYDVYRAPKKVGSITSKFYSKYDNDFDMRDINNTCSERSVQNRNGKNDIPLTENQTYGWMQTYLKKNSKKCDLNELFFPKPRCDITILQENFCKDYAMGPEPFMGKRFVL